MPIKAESGVYRYGCKTPYGIDVRLESVDGRMLGWEEYEMAVKAGEAPVLSRFLHVEGWGLKCHVRCTVQGWEIIVEGNEEPLSGIVVHKENSEQEEVWESKELDILIIGNCEKAVSGETEYFMQHPPFGPFFLILEAKEGFCERVGCLDLVHGGMEEGMSMEEWLRGRKRRWFRIG